MCNFPTFYRPTSGHEGLEGSYTSNYEQKKIVKLIVTSTLPAKKNSIKLVRPSVPSRWKIKIEVRDVLYIRD